MNKYRYNGSEIDELAARRRAESDAEAYYNGRSKSESVTMAAWCFIAVCILGALAAIYGVTA